MASDNFRRLVEVLVDIKIDEKSLKKTNPSWNGKNVFKHLIDNCLDVNFTKIMNHIPTKYKKMKIQSRPTTEKESLCFMIELLSNLYIEHTNKEIASTTIFYLKEYESVLPIQNMVTLWKEGLPFIALLSKISNGERKYENKGNRQSNYEYIKELCSFLDIPLVLTEDYFSILPDENCNCFQVFIFFKSKNIDVFNLQKTNQEEKNKALFDLKISEYLDAANKVFNCFDTEQNKLVNDLNIEKLKLIILTECRDNYNTVCQLRNQINNLSNQFNLPIPSDLIKIDDVKAKFDELNSKLHLQEEIIIFEKEIQTINSFKAAQYVLDKLKNKSEDYNCLINKVKSKMQCFQKHMTELINEYNQKLDDYHQFYDIIVNDIKSHECEDEISLKNNSLKQKFIDVESIYNKIKSIDHSHQLMFPEHELKMKLQTINKLLKEYKHMILLSKVENEFNYIKNKCEEISLEIDQFSEYRNEYDNNLCQKAKNEHQIHFPSCLKFEQLWSEMGNNSDFKYTVEDAKSMISKIQKRLDEEYEILHEKEKKSEMIENLSKSALDECEFIDKYDGSLYSFEIAEEKFKKAENIKNWKEDAKGRSIIIYTNNMKKAQECINRYICKREKFFDEQLNRIRNSIDTYRKKYLCETSSLANDEITYEKGSSEIYAEIRKIEDLIILNNKFFHKNNDINEIKDELEQINKNIYDLKGKSPKRIMQFIDDAKNEIILYQNKLKEELLSDNLELDNLTAQYLDTKGMNLLSKYKDIVTKANTIKDYIYRYNLKVEMIDTTSIRNIIHNYIVLYKSTLLLKPKSLFSILHERVKRCTDPTFSYAMAVILIYKFSTVDHNFVFDCNISELKSQIELNESFSSDAAKQILDKVMTQQTFECNFELDILTDLTIYLPNFNEYLINYICSHVQCKNDILKIVHNVTVLTDLECKATLIEITKQCLEKYSDIQTMSRKSNILTNNNNSVINDTPVIVCDFGSYKCKVGFSNDESPKHVFSSVIGRPSKSGMMVDVNFRKVKDEYIGDEVYSNMYLDHFYPIKQGIINYDYLEKIINYTFKTNLDIDYHKNLSFYGPPEYNDYTIFLVESPNTSKANREKSIQLMFETYAMTSYYSTCSSVLSTYSTGKTTGISLDVGYESSHIVPVYEGYHIPHAMSRLNLGGKDIESFLYESIEKQNINMSQHSLLDKKNFIHKLKEDKCYVALDFEAELKDMTPLEINYGSYVNNKQTINLFDERFKCTEILFNPSLINLSLDGIGKQLIDSVMKCNDDIHKDLCSSVILSGGSSLFKGFQERVAKEIGDAIPMEVNVVANKDREYAAWIGGSVLASYDIFPQMIVTHDEYNDVGPGIVHRKCI